MNWSFLVWFGIGLVVYLTGIAIFVLVRFLLNRRKYKKELQEKEVNDNEETK